MALYTRLSETVTLKSDEDLQDNPLATTHVIVQGDCEGLALNDMITRATGLLARVKETSWDAVNKDLAEEQIAAVRWICESCIVVGIEDDAVMKRNGEYVCRACAEDIDSRA